MFLFIIFGAIAIAAALGVILSRRPIYSALFLLLNFAALACLYIQLQAQFLAMVEVIVYAGAIVVLFLFVIMLIGSRDIKDFPQRQGFFSLRKDWARLLGIVFVLLLIAFLGYGIISGQLSAVSGNATAFGQGTVQAVGLALYTTYLFPFELTSVLLLVGMIGAVVLARKD